MRKEYKCEGDAPQATNFFKSLKLRAKTLFPIWASLGKQTVGIFASVGLEGVNVGIL